MTQRDLAWLIFLAAIWGASFLFMRLAVPEFGAIPTAFMRMGVASLFLLPLLISQRSLQACRGSLHHLALIGLINFAIPFSLWAFAMQKLPAGMASILNASTPMWGALVAWLWLNDKLTRLQVLGLLAGFAGVAILALGKSGTGVVDSGLAIAAALFATFAYGISANYTKRYLAGVPPLAVAGGCQLFAALFLLPLAYWQWPGVNPGALAWTFAVVLGVACTGIANVVYFRLIAHAGPATAVSTTFMIPAFGMMWGALFLDEKITALMLAGCAVILAGTALVTGAWKLIFKRD